MSRWMVRDVLRTVIEPATEQTPYQELVALLMRDRPGAVPVVDSFGIVRGIVTGSDLVRPLARTGPSPGLTAKDLMTTPAVCISPEASVSAAAAMMADRGVSQLLVVDQRGRLRGMVTSVDIVCARAGSRAGALAGL